MRCISGVSRRLDKSCEGRDVRLEESRTRRYVSVLRSRRCYGRHFHLQADAGVAVVLAFRYTPGIPKFLVVKNVIDNANQYVEL